MAVHRAIRHKQLRIARAYIDDEHTCTVCLVRFANYTRLVDHLSEKRMVCLLNVLIRPVPLEVSEEQQVVAKRSEQAQRRALKRHSYGREAAVQAYGPLNKLFIPGGTYMGVTASSSAGGFAECSRNRRWHMLGCRVGSWS